MPTNTPVVNPPARRDPRQVSNTLKATVNYNTANVANGVAFDNSLPQSAFILRVLAEIVVAFNGTTPSVTVGTVSTAYNNIIAAGDLDEGVVGVTSVTRALGRGLTAAADVTPFVKMALTTATTGQIIVVIEYEGGWAS